MRFPVRAQMRDLCIMIAAATAVVLAALPAVARADEAAAVKPLPPETMAFLTEIKLAKGAPTYIRIFKEESELEVWKARPDGRYLLIKTFPICTWSGDLGPKEAQGDRMAPEGFYSLGAWSMKPDSKYHLALNIGYPNALDKALGRTGSFIMVHGSCVSVGCFAMTDGLIEEIYAFVRESFEGGQERVPVHVFPFRMSYARLASLRSHAAAKTWAPLKEAYDDFDRSKLVPRIAMCEKRYVVNPVWQPGWATPDSAAAACPAEPGKLIAPVSPRMARKLFTAPMMALGAKMRTPGAGTEWGSTVTSAGAYGPAAASRQAGVPGTRLFMNP